MNDAIRAALDPLILVLLDERPDHGYNLMARIKTRYDIDLSDGALYPALTRLEAAGKITGSWSIGNNGRKRKIFELTNKGRAHLDRTRNEWPRFARVMSAALGLSGVRHA